MGVVGKEKPPLDQVKPLQSLTHSKLVICKGRTQDWLCQSSVIEGGGTTGPCPVPLNISCVPTAQPTRLQLQAHDHITQTALVKLSGSQKEMKT